MVVEVFHWHYAERWWQWSFGIQNVFPSLKMKKINHSEVAQQIFRKQYSFTTKVKTIGINKLVMLMHLLPLMIEEHFVKIITSKLK